jgi:hypothetical protein
MTLTRDFQPQVFFMNHPLGAVLIFFEYLRSYSPTNFITGDNITADQLFTGVNDTGNEFIAGD